MHSNANDQPQKSQQHTEISIYLLASLQVTCRSTNLSWVRPGSSVDLTNLFHMSVGPLLQEFIILLEQQEASLNILSWYWWRCNREAQSYKWFSMPFSCHTHPFSIRQIMWSSSKARSRETDFTFLLKFQSVMTKNVNTRKGDWLY